jgi:hypothetical protein
MTGTGKPNTNAFIHNHLRMEQAKSSLYRQKRIIVPVDQAVAARVDAVYFLHMRSTYMTLLALNYVLGIKS